MKKRYVVRAVQEQIVEQTIEAASPIEAILAAEERSNKWEASKQGADKFETRTKYTVLSARPEGA